MVVTAVLLLVMAIVSGIDLTRIFTSPTRILGKIGGAFANIVGESKAVPQSMRAGSGKALLRTVGEITTNIAVGQLIGILPTPYNIILFFLYYKTVTAIVICLIPVLFSLWALSMAWALRRELVKHLDDDERVPLVGDDGVEDIEAPRPKRNFGTSNTTQVYVSPQTRRVVPNYPIHSRDFTPDLQRSDTETAYTMRYDADTHNHPPNLYPRLNGHDE